MKVKEFIEFSEPIILEKYGLKVTGIWNVCADDDKVLVRKSDGKVVIEASLGVEYRGVDGKILEQPYIEKPEDYDEISVEEYKAEHPEWVDPREEES